MQEVQCGVALIAHSRGEIVRPVAFDVVVLNVVKEVRVPGMAHERVEDVGEDGVDQGVFFVQHAPHVDVLVHEQRVGAHVVELHGGVEDAVPPAEVVEEVQG